MRSWLKGTPGALLALCVVSLFVAGGLAWASAAALRLEHEQLVERAEAEHAARVREALWRLDGHVAPLLAREDSRAFDHYSTIFAPSVLFDNDGHVFQPGSVVQPSPLLHVELPEWMALHVQFDVVAGRWQSPQVPADSLRDKLSRPDRTVALDNLTERRKALLAQLDEQLPVPSLWPEVMARLTPDARPVRDRTLVVANPAQLYAGNEFNLGQNPANPNATYNTLGTKQMLEEDLRQRAGFQDRINLEQQGRGGSRAQRVNRDVAVTNWAHNGESWFGRGPVVVPTGCETFAYLGRLSPHWFAGKDGAPRLLAMRQVKLEDRLLYQGIYIEFEELQAHLLPQVSDLFPDAKLLPVAEADPDVPLSRMTSLPVQLDPGTPPAVLEAGYSTLRLGLSLTWLAAAVAFVAVALGAWSVLDLSERRMRFVSAVTHELRTPLTTLRLYLEMLLDGMVRDEKTRQEYLATLHAEAERLNRLVSNVLDYSRLEKTRPQLVRRPVVVEELLSQVRAAWSPRCSTTGKALVVESELAAGATLTTDGELVGQVLGNLIDNACKYSRDAADCRLWLRVRCAAGKVIFEVEDRGPGVPAAERASVFRIFQRGHNADASTGGVGLGLSLARRWAELLGGSLELAEPGPEGGACFRLVLPA